MATYKDVLVKPDANGFVRGFLKDGDPKISTHFRAAEFACPDCGEYRIHAAVLQGIEDLRHILGDEGITVVNPNAPGGMGFRCARYAAELVKREPNASKNSQHNFGKAADLHRKNISPVEFKAAAEKVAVFTNGGIGLYSWGIHVDMGPKRRWDYRPKKK